MSVRAEWVTCERGSALTITLPEPDEDYAYASTRLLSFWPIVNSRGATYERADFDDDLLKTLIGKQVNLKHDKSKVVGSIFEYAIADDGIDVGIRIDRDQAGLQGLDMAEMRDGNYFSHVSVELTWADDSGNEFYAYDDGFNIKRRMPATESKDMGVRRSTAADPFRLQGLRIAERVKPRRFTGVGLVPNPADRTATVYQATASDEEAMDFDDLDFTNLDSIDFFEDHYDAIVSGTFSEEAAAKALTPGSKYADPGYRGKVKRYPLDSEEHVRAAARFWGIPKYRAPYTPAQRAHISAAISAAKKRLKIGDASETAQAAATAIGDPTLSAETLEALTIKVGELEAQLVSLRSEKETASAESATRISELEAKLVEKETELASANEKIVGYEREKAEAAKNAKIDEFMTELASIHPFESDEAKTVVREKAFAHCDADGVIVTPVVELLRMEREKHALQAKLDAVKPADGGGGPSGGKDGEKKDKKDEQASDFSTEEDARQALTPTPKFEHGGRTSEYVPGQF